MPPPCFSVRGGGPYSTESSTEKHMNEEIEIPGMPSDDEIRAELWRTGDVPYWRPTGTFDGTATDFSAMPPGVADKVIQARLQLGPGDTGTPWQIALFDHQRRIINLEKEQARITDELTAVSSFDPATGEGISAASPNRQKALTNRLSEVGDELRRLHGEPGRLKLQKALDEAVKVQKARYRREYVQAEAKRRAAADTLEGEIERAAAGYRKTQPR